MICNSDHRNSHGKYRKESHNVKVANPYTYLVLIFIRRKQQIDEINLLFKYIKKTRFLSSVFSMKNKTYQFITIWFHEYSIRRVADWLTDHWKTLGLRFRVNRTHWANSINPCKVKMQLTHSDGNCVITIIWIYSRCPLKRTFPLICTSLSLYNFILFYQNVTFFTVYYLVSINTKI